ncbi:MAG: hypothetical protein FWC25_01000 [Dehalococcoidia bacterium]|nr:hypothetical protein [Dehalococcoidia bacterium]
MSEPTEWYHNLETSVETLKIQLGADARDFYLERFLKIARRVDEFAPSCQQCRECQSRMDNMQKDLVANAAQISKEQKRNFLGNIESILSHFKKIHGFISDGQNTAIFMAIGAGFGVALGAAFKNPVLGIPMGVVLGLIIGISLDARARKAGKVI